MTELFRNWPDDSVAIADEVIEWAPAAMHCVAIGTKRTYRGDLLFCPLSGVKRTWPKNGVMSAYDAVATHAWPKGQSGLCTALVRYGQVIHSEPLGYLGRLGYLSPCRQHCRVRQWFPGATLAFLQRCSFYAPYPFLLFL